MSMPRVSIVIPTRNRIEALKRCLDPLIPYVSRHAECSITVSDDGDAEETRKALTGELSQVEVVQGPRRGPAANRNNGASRTAGDLIVFLDDDCIPEPDLIERYQEAAASHPEIAVFEGRISAQGKARGFTDGAPENETGGYLWSCNFGVRRALFASMGGFDERFPFAAMEDCDFRFRVKRQAEILFVAAARVWHPVEGRLGWRIVKHRVLSDLLYLHLHGLEATRKGPSFYARKAARGLVYTGTQRLAEGAIRHPEQLARYIWADLEAAVILYFWKYHALLARRLFPPCCAGCESIHAVLSGKAEGGAWPTAKHSPMR